MPPMTFLPHGACWRWDWVLIVLHFLGDAGTGISYLVIPAIALYVYRAGRLDRLAAAYPRLWRRGAAFVLLCGLNHFGAAFEIWAGGWFYYLTGINKLCMLTASTLFASEFWRRRGDLVMIGRILDRAQEWEHEEPRA